jgi:hypothetical protein
VRASRIGAKLHPPKTCPRAPRVFLNIGTSHTALITKRWRMSKSAFPRSSPGKKGSVNPRLKRFIRRCVGA